MFINRKSPRGVARQVVDVVARERIAPGRGCRVAVGPWIHRYRLAIEPHVDVELVGMGGTMAQGTGADDEPAGMVIGDGMFA